MPTITRLTGVQFTLPENYRAEEPLPTPAPSQRGWRAGRQFGPVPLPASPGPALLPDLVAAFAQQDMVVLDQVQLVGEAAPARRGRKVTAVAPSTVELAVPLAPHEDAVVLLEQDGFYAWHFATETTPASPSPGKVSSAMRGAPATSRQARFAIALAESAAGPGAQRGVIGDFVRGPVRAFIFKFAARLVLGQAVKFLEHKVQRGLVHMAGLTSTDWHLLADPAALALPTTRPARVLLFVHGTFSSTLGGYAALTATPWGQAFLEAAQADYDLVLGFDHATLSEDPLANATELLVALQGLDWAYPPRLDVVAHSRGGLVVRCLLEHLLPLAGWVAQVERVIFVGVTNGGTLLASPANWQALVDLYTNLSLATCQVLQLLPQAQAAATVLEELVRGLGAFVKYCATTAVSERQVPGLAAMEPTGDFIRQLNQAQSQQPTIAQSYYCAVTSAFHPQVRGGTHAPRELPARLLQWVGSGLMGQLMREDNDLVVHTAAMTQLDPDTGNYFKDRLDFGPNPQVYHTNYFLQPRVADALTRWLRLPAPPRPPGAGAAQSPARRSPAPAVGGHAGAPPAGDAGQPSLGRFVVEDLPVAADLDVYAALSQTSVAEVQQAIQDAPPSYVVVQHATRGQIAHFAVPAEQVLALGKRAQAGTLYQELKLAEAPRARVVHSVGGLPRALAAALPPTVKPAVGAAVGPTVGAAELAEDDGLRAPEQAVGPVVLKRRDRVEGVVRPPAPPLDGPALAALAQRIARPAKAADRVLRRRTMPTFAAPTPAAPATLAAAPPRPRRRAALASSAGLAGSPTGRPTRQPASARAPQPTAPCHFRAEMDQEVVVDRPTTVEVVLSHEALGRAQHAAAREARAEVAPDTPLRVQVLPKQNLEYVEAAESYQREVLPPAPGSPQALYFTLRATHAGPGEVWVMVRQGQVPLLTLCLQPQVVTARGAGAGPRVQVAATATPRPGSTEAVHQLVIIEQRNGAQLTYRFQLQLPSLEVMQWGETRPFTGDRQTYVAQLYAEIEQRWVSTAADVANFTAELRALGATLFDELIPAELQRLLWQHRTRISSILVVAEEPFIPWELVHLHAPGKPLGQQPCFLGQLGLVRWLHEAGWPRQTLRLRAGKGRYVIPDYPHPDYALPEAGQEADFLRQELGAKRVPPTAQAVRTLLTQASQVDLLHFAGHGAAESANIANAQLLLQGRVEGASYLPEYLSASTVEQYANFGQGAPLIVLNACQVGRLGYRLTGVGGFAQAFLRRGAGAFVGTLWSVGDAPARQFTEKLYERLLAGDALAEATTAAREHARQAGDATWLAYAVYGHPYARVSR